MEIKIEVKKMTKAMSGCAAAIDGAASAISTVGIDAFDHLGHLGHLSAQLNEQEFRSEYEEGWSNLPIQPDDNKRERGFVFSGKVWLPRPLFEGRERQRRKLARENRPGVIRTR